MPADIGKEPRILVVDDDDAFRAFLEELLVQSGYQILVAASGKQAIEVAMAELPDLIVLDVMMPDISGGMAAHLLSENIATQNIPIIFLTSIISQEQEMMVGNQEGNYLFLAKPIRAEHLLKEVKAALQSSDSTA